MHSKQTSLFNFAIFRHNLHLPGLAIITATSLAFGFSLGITGSNPSLRKTLRTSLVVVSSAKAMSFGVQQRLCRSMMRDFLVDIHRLVGRLAERS